MDKNLTHIQGNALFLILIAVALFAALSYAITQSGRGGGTIDKEQMLLNAAQLVQYTTSIEQAITRLRLTGGCAMTDISAYSTEWATPANYDNVNTPVAGGDFSCHIFHTDGGGVPFQAPVPNTNDGSEWYISGVSCIEGVVQSIPAASTCNNLPDKDDITELIIFLPNIDKDLCIEINNRLGIANPSGDPPQESNNGYNAAASFWKGGWSSGYSIGSQGGGGEAANLNYQYAACFEGGNVFPVPGTYHFYQVLIPR